MGSKIQGSVPPTYQSDPGDESHHQGTPPDQQSQRISVGLSPLGGIGLNVTDASGTSSGALLSIEEAEQLAGRLQGLASILLHMGYIEAAQEQMRTQDIAKKIHLPGVK